MIFQAPPESSRYGASALTLADLEIEMSAVGLQISGQLIADGAIHRVPSSTKKRDTAGWYAIAILDNGLIFANYGDWRSGEKYKWSSREPGAFTAQEMCDLERHRASVNVAREQRRAEAAQDAWAIWNWASVNAALHPYLALKQIQSHNTRIAADDRLIVPVCIDGKISSLQYISNTGVKRFLPDGIVGGGFYVIAGDPQTAVVCEGFSTAATIAEATGFSVYCAFYADNLEKVVAKVKANHMSLIIAGDEDKWKERNSGRVAALDAARKHNCKAVCPTFSDETNKPTDFNDMARIDGQDAVRMAIMGAQITEQPVIRAIPFRWKDPKTISPRSWIYDRHYIRQFVSVTGGVGGVGKSSIQIVEALVIATGKALLGKEPVESCPVWYINLEDPSDEIDRRIMAALIHFGLSSSDIERRLFVSSGRDARFVMATDTADGLHFVQLNIQAFERQIEEYGIGVVILDPFEKLHRVPENSNDTVDAVVTELARISDEHNCSIELAHHLRKSSDTEPTVDDIRGAGALLGAVRSARLVVQMTESEAGKAGVKEHRKRYLRVIDGKGNMAPPSETSDWYFLESHDLDNATNDRPADWVGVATEWTWPDAFDGVTVDHANEVRTRVANNSYRADVQANDWVGVIVADVLGLDLDDQADNAKVNSVIKMWVTNDVLKVVERTDFSRKKRKFMVPGSNVPGGDE